MNLTESQRKYREIFEGLEPKVAKPGELSIDIAACEVAIGSWFENLPFAGARASNKTWAQILENFTPLYTADTIQAANNNLVSKGILIRVPTKTGAKAFMFAAHNNEFACVTRKAALQDVVEQKSTVPAVKANVAPKKAYSAIRYHKRNWSLRELCASKWNTAGISKSELDRRIKAKWSTHDALTVPKGEKPYDPFEDEGCWSSPTSK